MSICKTRGNAQQVGKGDKVKKTIKIILWSLVSIVLVVAVSVLSARYGWKLFGFRYCEDISRLYVESIEVADNTVTLNGNTMASAPAFVGYTYKIVDDKLYIGMKYNLLLGFTQRLGAFDITIKTNTSKITQVFLKDSQDEKRIWHKVPDGSFDFSTVKNIAIWDTEDFDGKIVHDIVIDGKLTSRYHLKTFTIDNEQTAKILGALTYKNNFVLWKGGKAGFLINSEIDFRKIEISNYGGFFRIDGIPGYFEISDELRDEWDEIISKRSYKPDLTEFKEYNDLFQAKYLPQQMGHLLFSFGDEYDFYVICQCNDNSNAPTNQDIESFIQLKYEQGVRLLKYSYNDNENNYLKLLYEDGTYFEWNQDMYCIKYLCDTD